jgi:hypothetical protein
MVKADNSYRLPVKIGRQAQSVTGGVVAAADVFSDEAHKNNIYSGLRVVASQGSTIATHMQNGDSIDFLLGDLQRKPADRDAVRCGTPGRGRGRLRTPSS